MKYAAQKFFVYKKFLGAKARRMSDFVAAQAARLRSSRGGWALVPVKQG